MFAEIIKERRIALGKSQQDIADCVGIERSYYTKIENGLKPSVKVAQSIAKVLGGFDWTIFFNENCAENAHPKTA